MKNYIGTKSIKAKPMTREEVEILLNRVIGGTETGDGYLVEYEDGYKSWSPKKVFDSAYRECVGIPFGAAIEALKVGKPISRTGWNGKGMKVNMVPAYRTEEGIVVNAWMAILNVNGSISTWVPSSNDCLADDWMITE